MARPARLRPLSQPAPRQQLSDGHRHPPPAVLCHRPPGVRTPTGEPSRRPGPPLAAKPQVAAATPAPAHREPPSWLPRYRRQGPPQHRPPRQASPPPTGAPAPSARHPAVSRAKAAGAKPARPLTALPLTARPGTARRSHGAAAHGAPARRPAPARPRTGPLGQPPASQGQGQGQGQAQGRAKSRRRRFAHDRQTDTATPGFRRPLSPLTGKPIPPPARGPPVGQTTSGAGLAGGPHRGTARVAAVTAAPGAASTRRQAPATPALVMAIGPVRAVRLRPVAAQGPPGRARCAPEDQVAAAPAREWVPAGPRYWRARRPGARPAPGARPGAPRTGPLSRGGPDATYRGAYGPVALPDRCRRPCVVAQVGVAGLDGPVASAVALVGAAARRQPAPRGAGSGAGKS